MASSAVTSAAINDMPDFASTHRDGKVFGRVRYRGDADARCLAVVRLWGLAGVQLLTRTNLTAELALACTEACLPKAQRSLRHRGRDSIDAVSEILRAEPDVQGLALMERAEHYLSATKAVVGSLWPCVRTLVDALLERQTLSRGDLMGILGPFQIYQPAHSALEAYGLAPRS